MQTRVGFTVLSVVKVKTESCRAVSGHLESTTTELFSCPKAA